MPTSTYRLHGNLADRYWTQRSVTQTVAIALLHGVSSRPHVSPNPVKLQSNLTQIGPKSPSWPNQPSTTNPLNHWKQ